MTMAKKVLLKPKKVAAKKKLKPKAPAVAKFNEAAMHTVFDTETTGLVTNRSIKLNRGFRKPATSRSFPGCP
jgi:hypothetical protein